MRPSAKTREWIARLIAGITIFGGLFAGLVFTDHSVWARVGLAAVVSATSYFGLWGIARLFGIETPDR